MNNYIHNCDDCKTMKQYYNETSYSPNEILYQRRCANYIYIVPDGLRELMSDISREVLRCNPIEIYRFIADYLDALLITRENVRVAAMLAEDVMDAGCTIKDILQQTNLSLKDSIKAAEVIQKAFRKHMENIKDTKIEESLDPKLVISKMMLRLNITKETASKAAKIIQHAWRAYKSRFEKWRVRFDNVVDWKNAARYTLQLYKKYAATREYTRAATLIQAAYRGYYTRKLIKQYAVPNEQKEQKAQFIQHMPETLEDTISSDTRRLSEHSSITDGSLETLYLMYDPTDEAARVIQRTFRKYIRNLTIIDQATKSVLRDNDLDNISNINYYTGEPIRTPGKLKRLEDGSWKTVQFKKQTYFKT